MSLSPWIILFSLFFGNVVHARDLFLNLPVAKFYVSENTSFKLEVHASDVGIPSGEKIKFPLCVKISHEISKSRKRDFLIQDDSEGILALEKGKWPEELKFVRLHDFLKFKIQGTGVWVFESKDNEGKAKDYFISQADLENLVHMVRQALNFVKLSEGDWRNISKNWDNAFNEKP